MSNQDAPIYDYGRAGRIGVATPQANPTVEAEFSLLYPRSVSVQASRLTSAETDPRLRLIAYFENLAETLSTYGGMPLSAFGFACTGSSYLVGRGAEMAKIQQLTEKVGYPVETASKAIDLALKRLGVKRIAIVAPYPDWLIDAAETYWRDAGYTITQVVGVKTRTSNTQTIYELTSDDASRMLAGFDPGDAEAVLVSGTGMPTLSAVRHHNLAIPVVSSNLCLAWSLLQLAGHQDLLDPRVPFISGWGDRLAELEA